MKNLLDSTLVSVTGGAGYQNHGIVDMTNTEGYGIPVIPRKARRMPKGGVLIDPFTGYPAGTFAGGGYAAQPDEFGNIMIVRP